MEECIMMSEKMKDDWKNKIAHKYNKITSVRLSKVLKKYLYAPKTLNCIRRIIL